MVKDLERRFALQDWEFERFAGLGVVDCDRHVPILRVPEQADLDAVADAAVKLAGHRQGPFLDRSGCAAFTAARIVPYVR
jgi:hypothetical protein